MIDLLQCNFCGKSQRQVAKLIAGPGVYICDECIGLCNEIIEEELAGPPAEDLVGLWNEFIDEDLADEDPAATEEPVARWMRWIDGPIKDDVAAMHARRDAWAAVWRMLEESEPRPDSAWWALITDTYIVTQAVAVGRQAAVNPDAAALARLVSEIADDASPVTRAWWAAGPLDSSTALADLDALRVAATQVRGHLDRHIARASAPAAQPPPEIHQAIDLIGALFRRYRRLLMGSPFGTPTTEDDRTDG